MNRGEGVDWISDKPELWNMIVCKYFQVVVLAHRHDEMKKKLEESYILRK
jgi:hypothetical protein